MAHLFSIVCRMYLYFCIILYRQINYFFLSKAYVDVINAKLPPTIRVMDIVRTTRNFNAKNCCEARTYSYLTPTFAFAPIDRVVDDNYRISQEVLDDVRNLLSYYEGTQNFHNFTIKKKPTDQEAKRVIISIECGEPFERDGLEWVHIKLKGWLRVCGVILQNIRRERANVCFYLHQT